MLSRSSILTLALFVVSVAHLWFIHAVPAGVHTDETAMGLNALKLQEMGGDAPVYSFTHMQNALLKSDKPLQLYTTFVAFSFFPETMTTVRLVSAFYFFIFYWAFLALVQLLFPERYLLQLYAILTGGLLPWFFTVSRIGYDTCTQLACMAILLLLTYRMFHTQKWQWWDPVAFGFVAGISLYGYPTARLLTPLYIGLVFLFYCRKNTWLRCINIIAYTLLAALPHLWFAFSWPQRYMFRTNQVGIVDNPVSLWRKLELFMTNYTAHWSPDFLLLSGDSNIRHATGHGGQLFLVVGLCFVLCVCFFALLRECRTDRRFLYFLLFNCIAAPSAAALTHEGIPHALRSVLLGLYVLLLSCFGFLTLSHIFKAQYVRNAHVGLITLLCLEASAYIYHYNTHYRNATVRGFGGYGIESAVAKAYQQDIDTLYISPGKYGPTFHFYAKTVPNPNSVKVDFSGQYKPEPRTCLLRTTGAASSYALRRIQFDDLSEPSWQIKLYCF